MASIAMEDSSNNQNQKKNISQQEEEEAMIPVLTVFKNNTIIKNIVIVLNNNDNKNGEQSILIGRHANCNIVLTHPSISRFHLIIRFTPSSRSLSIQDLSSVHGTWIGGKKLDPGVSVDLKEGDSFTIGVSSRVYLLRFVKELKDVDSLCCDERLYPFLSPPCVHSVDDDTPQTVEACSQQVETPTGETNLLCTMKEYFTQNICMPVVEVVQGTKLNQLQGATTFTAQQQQPSSVEDFWFTSPPTTDPVSFLDESAAAVAVIPKEPEFRDGAEMEDILTGVATDFNSHNMVDSENHQANNVVEEASLDSHSLSDGEKQEECCQEDDSKLHNLNAESCHDEKGYSTDEMLEDIGNKGFGNMAPESFDENEMAAVTVIPKELELACTVRDNDRIEDSLTTGARFFNSVESSSLPIEEAITAAEFQQIKIVEEVAVDLLSDGEEQNKCDRELNSYLTPKSCDEGYSLDKVIEDTFHIESLNSSVPEEADLNILDEEETFTPKKENSSSPNTFHSQFGSKSQTPQSVAGWFDVEILGIDVEEANDSNIWPRSGMSASTLQDRARKSRFINTSNVDTKVEMSNMNGTDIINRSMPKDIFSVLDEDEEEIFTPKDLFSVLDEEEMFTPKKQNASSPNTLHSQFMRKKGRVEESKQHSMSQRLHNLNDNFSPNIYLAERSASATSNKENQTPELAQEWKSQRKPLMCQDIVELKLKKVERVPLQSLMNSGGNHISGKSSPFSAVKTVDGATARASNCGQISIKHTKPSHISGEGKGSWDMVVDTASLLDKESRKALQLLQGLKGTRLIIPESVIRELGGMTQQYRLFRRTSEADLALQMIKECMENTKWWIHIQSSMVIEDDILDYALQYRRKENAARIVLLSNDVTFKIKSMAKGLLCETAQQFRGSLVNPFSDRFMWAESAPRGLTWSCHDDVVLREMYSGLPSKAGLKLINSTLAMMMWF